MAETVPTTGYDDDGKAQVFHLKPGEKLPKGWHSEPAPWHHPNNPNFGKGKPTEGYNEGDTVTIGQDKFTMREVATPKPIRKKK